MHPLMQRRQLLASAAALATSPMAAWAQAYPSRAVKIVVGSAPGGPTDFTARVAADQLSQLTGGSFVVENKPGASGMPAAEQVARATPDGYSLLVSGATAITVVSHMGAKMNYDPMKQLVPVTLLGAGAYVLAVHPSVPARNLRELIALAKAKPDGLTYASGGIGSGSHLCTELFCRMAAIKMTHIPYKGDAQGFTDLMAGQVQMHFVAPNVALAAAKEGRARVIAVTSADRLALFPDVAAMGEDLKDFEYLGWVGLFATGGTPQPVIDTLANEWKKARAGAQVKEKLGGLGMMAPDRLTDRAAATRFVQQDNQRMGDLIRALGLTMSS
jgi:tripartite-type tricarboxylate transporter receptor subunit TctC